MAYRHIAGIALASLLLPLFTGCTNDPVAPARAFTVTADSMPQIAGDAYYELWLSYPKAGNQRKGARPDHDDENYFSVGRFVVDAAGNLQSPTGGAAHFAIPSGRNAQLIGDAIVTVESGTEAIHEPGPRVMAGVITGNASHATALLKPSEDEAFGGKLYNDSSGYFSLVAPTSSSADDSVSGVWFTQFLVDASNAIVDTVDGLRLAPQPLNEDNPDWTYQAWLIRNEGKPDAEYIKLGRFNAANAADENGAGPRAGSAVSSAFANPGEDFVSGTRRMLNDGTYHVVVSVEPTGFDLSRPLLPVLVNTLIPAGISSHAPIPLFRPITIPSLQIEIDR